MCESFQDPTDDLLRHVAVDQLGAECVTPLVRRQLDRLAVLIADVAAFQPAAQRPAVGVTCHRLVPVRVAGGPREQHGRAAWPAGPQPLIVLADGVLEFLIDRDERFPVHFVVEVTQVGRSIGVTDEAVTGQPHRVGDAQPAAHQDKGDQPVAGVVPPGEVVRVLQLSHHVLAERPGQPLCFFGEILGEEHRVRWQRVIPAVLPDRGEEHVQLANHVPVHHPAGQLGMQAGQVALQHAPVHLVQAVDAGCGTGEEPPEADDRPSSRGG